MQTDQYNGIDKLYRSEYKASSSKFYGYLFPVVDISDFEQQIKSYKIEFADANHVCSACVIGVNREYQRCCDDGEHSNSSGRPILNNLLSAEISYVGCVVVRYFGGKKLGIPGLIEAYGKTSLLCLEDASIEIQTLKETTICSINSAKSYLLYNYLSRQPNISYQTTHDGKFSLTHAQSMTPRLHEDLLNIATLAIIDK